MVSVLRRLAGMPPSSAVLALLAAVVMALSADAAAASQMRVYVCHDPSGEAAVQEDWSIGMRNRVSWMYAEDTCAAAGQGYLRAALGASADGFAGFPSEPYVYWSYDSPAWARIASFDLRTAGSYAYQGVGRGVGEAWIEDSEKTDPNYDLRNLGGGAQGPVSVTDQASGTMTSIQVLAACDGQDGPCPANTPISSIEVSSGSIVLEDLTAPAATVIGGSLTEPGQITGAGEISVHATDADGPGIYSAHLEVDGSPQPAIDIGESAGRCRDLRPSAAIPSFDATHPCPSELDSSLTLDTAPYRDGPHAVRLYVQDAAGSSVLAWAGTIHTHNAPTIAASPAITGTAQVGDTLSAAHGSYTAPEGAGPLSSVTGRWLRCTDEAGQHCSAIPGATGQTYAPTAADAGYRLLYQDTIGDNDGATKADSATTVPVAGPAGSTSPAGGTSSAPGTGSAPSTSSAASTTCAQDCSAAAGGSATSSSTSASSMTIDVSQSPQAKAGRQLRRPAAWRVTLQTRLPHARRRAWVTLTGRVSPRPLPPHGKIVDLRARTVYERLVVCGGRRHYRRVYSRWHVFAVLRTRRSGGFSYRYALDGRGHRHAFQVQAVAPREGGYADAGGRSAARLIRE